MEDLLESLQGWYADQCDEEWEHNHGVTITTCDNPGWWVKIDLVGTGLQARPFARIADGVDASGFQQGERWLHCYVEEDVWHGAGDVTRLASILKIFLDWARQEDPSHEG